MAPPVPLRTAVAEPWWQALARREVAIQRCRSCCRHIHYPRAFCPHCGARGPEWVTVSGKGTLHSFTVARAPVSQDFKEMEPQVLCIADLDEGVRVVSTLVDVAEADLRVGMRLRPVFDDTTFEGLTVLRFTADGSL